MASRTRKTNGQKKQPGIAHVELSIEVYVSVRFSFHRTNVGSHQGLVFGCVMKGEASASLQRYVGRSCCDYPIDIYSVHTHETKCYRCNTLGFDDTVLSPVVDPVLSIDWRLSGCLLFEPADEKPERARSIYNKGSVASSSDCNKS